MAKHPEEFQNRPKPFSKERTRQTVGMVVYFYCVFFVIMKVIAVFQGHPALPHFLIAIPFIGLAIWGFKQQRTRSFSWLYSIIGIVLISVLRYYELDLITFLNTAL